ncbi:HK97 gp10 family phage protein [Hoeflea sp. G2-23]|uniref:HK97 gp10 family phage protein n=1 Tax=Hoeflea algicola TaxID=2983763 RepID=A0ABT3ZGE8_9HYPH|nr:HK97 gp10 family phage protein [Hoeflea algicola]MCY0150885.1 HK97 gp10 family phage protein [Hoeflea algicola]
MAGFSAQVDAFVSQTEQRTTAVFKQSAQDVLADAQTPTAKGGRMRVDTGFLRNSHVSGLNGSTSLSGPESYVLTIAQAKLGDAITGGWTANYAVHREFGARGQAPDFFLRGAAQKWPAFVRTNAAKLKARIG